MELLPCPFCGGEAVIENTVMDAVAKCTKCYARILRRHDSETDEIGLAQIKHAWNSRHRPNG